MMLPLGDLALTSIVRCVRDLDGFQPPPSHRIRWAVLSLNYNPEESYPQDGLGSDSIGMGV